MIVAIQSALDDATIVISKYEGTNELCVQLATAKDKESQKKCDPSDTWLLLPMAPVRMLCNMAVNCCCIRPAVHAPH